MKHLLTSMSALCLIAMLLLSGCGTSASDAQNDKGSTPAASTDIQPTDNADDMDDANDDNDDADDKDDADDDNDDADDKDDADDDNDDADDKDDDND